MRLAIKSLHAAIDGKEILKGVTLNVKAGEVVALMGPNGSGKSTLSNVIMGHPHYEVTDGKMLYEGEDLADIEVHERAQKGIFLSFQHPVEIPGLVVEDFLRESYKAVTGKEIKIVAFKKLLKEKMALLGMDKSFAKRYLNQGFSGGEKKRMEILQMALLSPKLAILDETDSGLDIDALRSVAKGVNALKSKQMGVLVITHYKRILEYLQPDRVIVLVDGKVASEGKADLVDKLEDEGYEFVTKQ